MKKREKYTQTKLQFDTEKEYDMYTDGIYCPIYQANCLHVMWPCKYCYIANNPRKSITWQTTHKDKHPI